jgi:hypothetical protein
MKKIIIALLLISVMITPCYAVNIFDTLLCKRVVLCANHITVLVNRITGEVKYMRLSTGQWLLLTGAQKVQFQSMHNAQITLKLVCD